MKMIDHNHFICHLILGTFTEYPFLLYPNCLLVEYINDVHNIMEVSLRISF